MKKNPRNILIFFLGIYRKNIIKEVFKNILNKKISKRNVIRIEKSLIKKIKNLSVINFYGIILLSYINFFISILTFFKINFFLLNFKLFKKIKLFYLRLVLFISVS
jgi:hypothetical protein